MSFRDPEIEDVLAPMRDGPVALSGTIDSAALRAKILPGLRAEVRNAPLRARRARVRRRALAGAGVLGVTLIAFAALRTPAEEAARPLHVAALGSEPATWIDADGARHALDLDAAIDGVGELVAPETSAARVSTARGVRVELAARSRLRVTAERKARDGGALRLEAGEVRCRVPKLGAEDHFSISTPDAEVVVHGTVFSVRVGAPTSPRTCVRVQEGLVEVRHGGSRTFLRAGTEWGCEKPETSPVAKRTAPALPQLARGDADDEPPQASSAHARSRAKRGAHRIDAERSPAGTLAAENALLAAALSAERGHDRERAHTLFTTLLERHPGSPLAPEASAGALRTR